MNDPIDVQLSDHGKNLYIFFGGIAAGIAMPAFEFYNASRILDEHKIFVRDFSQCWYQDGLSPISSDINATVNHLSKIIEDIDPKKIYYVGNSMGGYAAIMFSRLIGNGEVIAFAPQTFISPLRRLRHRDTRWMKKILTTYRKSLFKRKIWDLKPLLAHSEQRNKISIYVSTADRLDHIHAQHISEIEGVVIHEFEKGGHGVVKVLRDRGLLPAIMSGTYSKPIKA